MGERYVRNVQVSGSIPLTSTSENSQPNVPFLPLSHLGVRGVLFSSSLPRHSPNYVSLFVESAAELLTFVFAFSGLRDKLPSTALPMPFSINAI